MMTVFYLSIALLGVYAQYAHWSNFLVAGIFIIAGYALAIRDNPEILDK